MRKSVFNSLVTRILQEGILLETIYIMGKHINTIIEKQWHQTTNTTIRKYYGIKLSATPMSIFEEIGKESSHDWLDVDIPNYLNHKKIEKEKLFKEIKSPRIISI